MILGAYQEVQWVRSPISKKFNGYLSRTHFYMFKGRDILPPGLFVLLGLVNMNGKLLRLRSVPCMLWPSNLLVPVYKAELSGA